MENEQIEEIAKIIGKPCYTIMNEAGIEGKECTLPYECHECSARRLYAEDYRKVRHGTWKRGESNGKPYAVCTACGLRMNSNCYGYPYCNLCGARMDGDR